MTAETEPTAVLWITDAEPTAVPVGSGFVRASDDIMFVLAPDRSLYAVFAHTSTVMRVPATAAPALIAEHFDGRVVAVLHD
jgi:hypothetical protein